MLLNTKSLAPQKMRKIILIDFMLPVRSFSLSDVQNLQSSIAYFFASWVLSRDAEAVGSTKYAEATRKQFLIFYGMRKHF